MRLEQEEGLAILTFDNPPRNLFDSGMFADFGAVIEKLSEIEPRALLIAADGPVVSGGVDINFFHGLTAAAAASFGAEQLRTIGALERLPFPTVFAAHSLTLTAAFEIALACDLIVASPAAKFGLVERVVGLTPLMGGTQRLAARAGEGRTRELVMTGHLYSAEELLRWGVVNRVYPKEEFHAAARRQASDLAAGPTLAFSMTKHLLRRFREGGIAAADAAVVADGVALFDSEDVGRAVAAFVQSGVEAKVDFAGR
jgi:enoyl-CoA hydratase/carnithine racemase